MMMLFNLSNETPDGRELFRRKREVILSLILKKERRGYGIGQVLDGGLL
jgi:hypothetical protein